MDNLYGNANEESAEAESWWSGSLVTLAAGLACGVMANILVRRFTSAKTPSLASLIPHMDNKMVLAIRSDLGMTKGKVAAQCAHAAIGCYKKAVHQTPEFLRNWETFGQTKVTLKVDSEETIRDLQAKAEAKGLVTSVVRDAGRTQVDPGTVTVIGIGPGPTDLVDSITRHLKLY